MLKPKHIKQMSNTYPHDDISIRSIFYEPLKIFFPKLLWILNKTLAEYYGCGRAESSCGIVGSIGHQ